MVLRSQCSAKPAGGFYRVEIWAINSVGQPTLKTDPLSVVGGVGLTGDEEDFSDSDRSSSGKMRRHSRRQRKTSKRLWSEATRIHSLEGRLLGCPTSKMFIKKEKQLSTIHIHQTTIRRFIRRLKRTVCPLSSDDCQVISVEIVEAARDSSCHRPSLRLGALRQIIPQKLRQTIPHPTGKGIKPHRQVSFLQ